MRPTSSFRCLSECRAKAPAASDFYPLQTGTTSCNMAMIRIPEGNPLTHPLRWARRCRIEAARAIHPATKAFLQELARQFEAAAGEAVNLDPDDPEIQEAVAERLLEVAAKKKRWTE